MGIGEFKIWFDDATRLGCCETCGGTASGAGDVGCHNLSLKIAAKSARANIVSSPTLANGTTGCEFCKASVMSLAAMSNRSADDNCGI
jgi:hypothetical protein